MRIKVRHCPTCKGKGQEQIEMGVYQPCPTCDHTGHIVSVHEEDFSWWKYLVGFAKSFKGE